MWLCRGDISDYVLMEGRGFGFVTYVDPASAQAFLEASPSLLQHFLRFDSPIELAGGLLAGSVPADCHCLSLEVLVKLV